MATRLIRVVSPAILGAALCAGTAFAQVPQPNNSQIPEYIYLVGRINGGANPDPFGLATIVVRDATNAPVAGIRVTLDFSGCCDLVLCSSQTGIDCAGKSISGTTNASGQYTFTAIGAARDPGNLEPPAQYPGCESNGIVVRVGEGVNEVIIGQTTGVCLDQNGGAGQSNGTTGSDVSNVKNLFGAVSLGAPYRGRGDLDRNGQISGADVSAMINHFGRLGFIGSVGCTDGAGVARGFCATPACP